MALLFHQPLLIDPQDYDFDYSDGEDAEESGNVDVENMYYKAKCALLSFRSI